MSQSFQCEHCHETVDAATAPPSCKTCGTTYRYDFAKAAYRVETCRAQFYNIIALLLMILGIAGLLSSKVHSGIGWFFVFAGFALHYWNGLRSGVLSSRFFFFRWHWTVYRAESPTGFTVAAIIEGLWVVGFFFIFIFSL